MNEAQRQKNIRVEQEIMGVSLRAETNAEIEWELQFWPGRISLYRGARLAAWHEREGTDYQESMEQYIESSLKKPRDFCNSFDHVHEMETRLDEMGLMKQYVRECGSPHSNPVLVGWYYRHPPSPQFCVDAALRALDSVKARGDAQ